MTESFEGWGVVLGFVTQPHTVPIVLMAATLLLFTWLSFRERRSSRSVRRDDSLVR